MKNQEDFTDLYKWEELAQENLIPEAIVAYIKEFDWVTIPRLMDAFEPYTQTKGEYTIRIAWMPDVVHWSGIAKNLCVILDELFLEGRIHCVPVHPSLYLSEGADLSMVSNKENILLSTSRIYWLPIALRPGRYAAPGQPGAAH